MGFEETETIGPDGKAHIVSEKTFNPSGVAAPKLTKAQRSEQAGPAGWTWQRLVAEAFRATATHCERLRDKAWFELERKYNGSMN